MRPVLDRPLMERDLFVPERSRVLPPYSQLPRRIGSIPATGAALGAGEAVSPPSVDSVPLPRRNLASRRRTSPQLEEDELQEQKRLKAGSDSLSESASPSNLTSTSLPFEKREIPPITRRNTPPDSPSPPPNTPPVGMIDIQEFEEQDPEGERAWDNTSYATLPPIQQEPTPGPSSAPHSYAGAAAAPRMAPPSPPLSAQTPDQTTGRQTAKSENLTG
ncbi:unnamed protein product [Parnassius mnemosyne]|uniref:Uncharacterized protein n=1 Tax=Parnassius mnemosyne TaxID=213953 RepID=A0AAV1M3E4_9NEOP